MHLPKETLIDKKATKQNNETGRNANGTNQFTEPSCATEKKESHRKKDQTPTETGG